MTGMYRKLSREEEAINVAIDTHRAAKKDENQAFMAAFGFYSVGILLVVVNSNDSRGERVGNALIICGLIMIAVHVALSVRTRHYAKKVKELANPYLRKKALPFYHELLAIFAAEPGIHLHLEDDGKITVTDKRKRNNA